MERLPQPSQSSTSYSTVGAREREIEEQLYGQCLEGAGAKTNSKAEIFCGRRGDGTLRDRARARARARDRRRYSFLVTPCLLPKRRRLQRAALPLLPPSFPRCAAQRGLGDGDRRRGREQHALRT